MYPDFHCSFTVNIWLSWLDYLNLYPHFHCSFTIYINIYIIILTCILTSIAVSQGIYVHLRYIVHLTWLSWLASYINWLHCPFNLIILTCILHTLNFFVHLTWLSWLASYIHWLLCPINLIILTCILHTLNSMFPNYVCTRGCHLMKYS